MRSKKSIVFLILLIGVPAVFSVLLYPEKASSGPFLNSTHGNSSYGVYRTSISAFGYPRGHCTHCHEQHASIGGSEPAPNAPAGPDQFLLFSDNYTNQTENVCLKCHTDLDSYQAGGLVNRSYSYRAGGYSSDPLNDIREAFNFCSSGCGDPSTSSHNLGDIRTFITGGSVSWGYTADSNPCTACHNPHMVIGDPANAPNSGKTSGARGYSPVSRPSLHSKVTSDWGLWGDVAAERMDQKAPAVGAGTMYQAPYNDTDKYEPDGSSTENGSNLTDFVSFCTDCHNGTNTIATSHSLFDPSTQAIGRYTLFKFNWPGEHHGGYANTNYCKLSGVSLLASPYNGLTDCGKHVLSCTDCHEPHGSTNNYLVRPRVNNGFNDCNPSKTTCESNGSSTTVTYYGKAIGPDGKENKEWVYLCGKCHTNLNSGDMHSHPRELDGNPFTQDCFTCHPGGGDYINCGECHYHGNKYTSIYGVDRPLF